MYWKFYGLREDPFGLSPDSRYLYLTEPQQEVLSTLEECIEGQRGFVALTSPPGLGKTTLLFHFLEKIRSTSIAAFVFQTTFGPLDILRLLWKELGLDSSQADMVKLHQQFEDGLSRVAAMGKQFVLVVDEAQNLSPAALETIRLLANFETQRKKMVHIVLAGHPELEHLLAKPGLEHIKQRIAAFCRLKPFMLESTRDYVVHRLKVAGAKDDVFTTDGLHELAKLSKGVARTINIYAFQAMMKGSKKGLRPLDAHAVRTAIYDFEGWPLEKDAANELADEPISTFSAHEPSSVFNAAPEAAPMFASADTGGASDHELQELLASIRHDIEDARRVAQLPATESSRKEAREPLIPPPVPSFQPTAQPTGMMSAAAAMKREAEPKAETKIESKIESKIETKIEVASVAEQIAVMPAKAKPVTAPITVEKKTAAAPAATRTRIDLRKFAVPATAAIIVALLSGGGWYAKRRGWWLKPATAVAAPVTQTVAVPANLTPHIATETTAAAAAPIPAANANQAHTAVSPAKPGTTDQPKKPSAPPVSEIATDKTRKLVIEDAPAPQLAAVKIGGNAPNLSALGTSPSQNIALQSNPSAIKPAVPIQKPAPLYPAFARQNRLSGTVVLAVKVDAQGNPTKVTIVSGPPVLAASAQNTVRTQWKFSPAMVSGRAVEGDAEVRINFAAPAGR